MRPPPPIWKAKQFVYSIPIKIEAEQAMKVLAIAVLLACWASAVEPQKPSIYTLRFTATDATKGRYDAFMIDLRRVLTLNENAVQGIPVLPSTNDLKPTDLNRYVVVELFTNNKKVSLVIDVTNVYILGYRPGDGTASYFFNSVPVAVQNLYDALEGKAGEDRDKIPLGFAELHQKIENLNHYKPKDDIKKVASSLLVCFQMISEAARYKYIQQQIAALAPVVPGGAGKV
ncbi:ribosome-inactivating protein alpha-trichosanthin-like [Hibiscus syriacus]|uniref:ribosome-inactivating protein alpha-trichosanthin-like n=1 Tax=Hibiscus syriacus TaxID=106335 RepID=UPI001923DDB9|nr:ribosome-inactivating protein alpha-trichosanthin-like [Hibiscus syriacus]